MKLKLIFSFLIVVSLSTIGYLTTKNNSQNRVIKTVDSGLNITVYSSPTCKCCNKWINHLKRNNFIVTSIQSRKMSSIKQKYNLPKEMESCHTAIIDGYIIEGHVPAKDIKLLLKTKPSIAGLSVPEMPVGTPGMEMKNRKDPFNVVSFDKNKKFDIFSEYKNY